MSENAVVPRAPKLSRGESLALARKAKADKAKLDTLIAESHADESCGPVSGYTNLDEQKLAFWGSALVAVIGTYGAKSPQQVENCVPAADMALELWLTKRELLRANSN